MTADPQAVEVGALVNALLSAAERVRADLAAVAVPLGLTGPMVRALLLLDEAEPMHTLAGALRCKSSYVTVLADRLCERGLARRVRTEDRRVRLLELTEQGRAVRDELQHGLLQTDCSLGRLGASSHGTLAELLTAMSA